MTIFNKYCSQKLNLIFVFILLFLVGCSQNEQNSSEITFWGMGSEGEYIQKLIPEFERLNPGIKVKVQMVPWTAAQEKLISAYASDNLPDVFQLGNTWVPQFVALNAIENLDTFVSKSSIVTKENYFEGIWNTNEISGSIYGIPWYVDTRLLFYRKDILQKAGYNNPPKTWAEFYDVSKNIKKNIGNDDKYAVYLPVNEWAPFVIFGMQAGSTVLKDNDSYGNFSGAEFTKGFEFLINFHKENLAPIGISQVYNVYQAFAEEYFAIYISGPWNIKEFKKWMTGNLADKWMTAPLPSLNSDSIGVSLAGGASLVISKNSKKKEAAWKFIEFLSLPKTQLKFYELANSLPAVKPAWEDPLLQNDPYLIAFYTQFHSVVPTPKIPEWEQIAFSKLQQYAELAARNSLTVNEALQNMDKDVNVILEKRRWLLEQNNAK